MILSRLDHIENLLRREYTYRGFDDDIAPMLTSSDYKKTESVPIPFDANEWCAIGHLQHPTRLEEEQVEAVKVFYRLGDYEVHITKFESDAPNILVSKGAIFTRQGKCTYDERNPNFDPKFGSPFDSPFACIKHEGHAENEPLDIVHLPTFSRKFKKMNEVNKAIHSAWSDSPPL